MGKKVLVTGGRGRIGQHLVRALVESGREVFTFDILDKEDIYDLVRVEKAIDGMDEVYHLACVNDTGFCVKSPAEMFRVNAVGTANVLDACMRLETPKVLVASSTFVYQGKDDVEHDMRFDFARPVMPYSAGKIVQEFVTGLWQNYYDRDIIVARYEVPFGPGMTNVFVALAKKALQNQPITIMGDGNQGRCYLYIDDLVRANIFLMDNVRHGIFTLAGQDFLTVNDIVDEILEQTESESEVSYQYGVRYDYRGRMVNSDPLRKLGWVPMVNFEDGVKNTIEWVRPMVGPGLKAI